MATADATNLKIVTKNFGVLDSHRADVNYEDFRGHKLDRQMLQLLQSG